MSHRLVIAAFALTLVSVAASADTLNIRTNPFMVFGSFVNLKLDVRAGNQQSIGPMLRASVVDPEFEAGLRYTYYEQGVFQPGWMLSVYAVGGQEVAGRVYDPVTFEESDELDWLARVGVNQGYMWRWDTFNLGVGLGAALGYYNSDERLAVQSDLHFSIGWVR